jgi:hypothetical protein
LYCNGTELCLSGSCSVGTNPCSEDSYTCTTITCNDTTDSCDISYDDTICDDSNACTDDTCTDSGGDATTGCQITNNTNSCDDSDACTENDTCSLGVCAGSDIADCGADTLTTGLIAHYPFEGDASDTSGNSNNGTPVGDTSLTTGISGQGYAFDGDGDYISLADLINGANDFSISAWVKPATVTGEHHLLSGAANQQFYQTGTSLVYKTNSLIVVATSVFSLDTWTHVSAIHDGTNIILYADGAEVQSQVIDATDTVNGMGIAAFRSTGSFVFNGTMDEVRIYNRALSSDEVLELYNLHDIAYSPKPDSIGFFTRLAMGWFR